MEPNDHGRIAHNHPTLLTLPAEIRIAILEYVFNANLWSNGFVRHSGSGEIVIDGTYRADDHLQPLLTCRQTYHDTNLLALSRTNFAVSNLFFRIPDRLSILSQKQIASIRNIAFVADARHFRRLVEWHEYPFDMRNLKLDNLTIVLHRSSFWHYLFDFTAGITKVLRKLKGVRRFVILRNNALVKGSFHAWYNRLVSSIMRLDYQERYKKEPPNPEETWWDWTYDASAQRICLEARPVKPLMDEESYMKTMKPYEEELRKSEANEEWNPDWRSRNGF